MKRSNLLLVISLFALSFSVLSCATPAPAATSASEDKTAEVKPVETPKIGLEFKTIYFDFNMYSIRKDQDESANAVAKILKENPKVKVQIQGNTDDRGSVEYNMALGNKRAESLKKYLVTKGVSVKNLSTVSFGKEHPAVQGKDETAWSKNRRDDIVEQK